MREWAPGSLKTYVNALAQTYKDGGAPHVFVPSSTKQFPRFNHFFDACATRFKNRQAAQAGESIDAPPLSENELKRLDQATGPDVFQQHRMNVVQSCPKEFVRFWPINIRTPPLLGAGQRFCDPTITFHRGKVGANTIWPSCWVLYGEQK